jgi:CheY-like chemotaxis protein
MLKPRSHRILIVEDEKDWVTLMTRALENEIEDRVACRD